MNNTQSNNHNTNKIAKGNTIYILKYNTFRTKTMLHKTTIEKVGRKYFYVNNLQFDIKTMKCMSEYFPNATLYFNKEEYENKIEYSEKMNTIEKFFSWHNNKRDKLTLDDLRNIYKIIEKELGV
jgi:hypothetical protein